MVFLESSKANQNFWVYQFFKRPSPTFTFNPFKTEAGFALQINGLVSI